MVVGHFPTFKYVIEKLTQTQHLKILDSDN